MLFIVISLIVLSLGDAMQPQNIAILLRLVPVCEDKRAPLLYIVTLFLGYIVLGVCVYVGMMNYNEHLLQHFLKQYPNIIGMIVIAGTFVLAVNACIHVYGSLKHRNVETLNASYALMQTTTPLGLAQTALLVTGRHLPKALPYFLYIAILVKEQTMPIQAVLYTITYSLLYITPMLFIYAKATTIPQAMYGTFELKIKKRVQKITAFSTPILYLIIAITLLREGLLMMK